MPRWFPGLEKACRRRFKCRADMQVQSRCCCRVAPRERGGLVALFNLLLGCISPGGVGLYSLLLLTFIAAFLGALMIGRTP
jgi:Potassium-transporting ATPase A subunit